MLHPAHQMQCHKAIFIAVSKDLNTSFKIRYSWLDCVEMLDDESQLQISFQQTTELFYFHPWSLSQTNQVKAWKIDNIKFELCNTLPILYEQQWELRTIAFKMPIWSNPGEIDLTGQRGHWILYTEGDEIFVET